MAGLVYYAPGRERALTTADAREHLLRELGLEYLGAQSLQSRHVLTHGPDGKSGVVFTSNTTARLGYYPGEQTWVPGPEGKYWIGWATDNPPVPPISARDAAPGIELTLATNVWQIARSALGRATHLPTVYRLSKDGVQAEVIPPWRSRRQCSFSVSGKRHRGRRAWIAAKSNCSTWPAWRSR